MPGKSEATERVEHRPRGHGYTIRSSEAESWRPLGFDTPSGPQREVARELVRKKIAALADSVDEGNAAVLDLQIEAWVAEWLAAVETQHIHNRSEIIRRLTLARQWHDQAVQQLATERSALKRVRSAYKRAKQRLASESNLEPDIPLDSREDSLGEYEKKD